MARRVPLQRPQERSWAQGSRQAGRAPIAALATALAAHAVLFYALARAPGDTLAGGGGQQLDAISVTLVNSSVLEAREPISTAPPAPAAAAPIETDDGSAQSTPAPERKKKEAAEETPAIPAPSQADAVLPLPPENMQEERQEASTAAPAGGAAARGDAPASHSPRTAPAAASPGAVREYARYVSQALARSRPRGSGAFGTVRIRLVIAQGGGLASVAIMKSSGNRRLDRMALAAVQSAALPLPPTGMTTDQLTYEVPYHFR
jgi:periplasmic protein TonB